MSYRRYYTPHRESGERRSRDDDPTLQLERERIANDMKLKGRFEHIFQKYAQDFSNVGDEIDMETGEIVVDNGHITFMQHERDVGSGASSQFVAAFAEELEEEEEEEEDEEDEEEDARDGEHEEPDAVDDVSEDDLALHRNEQGRADEEGDKDEEDEEEYEEDELSNNHSPSQRTALAPISRPQTPSARYRGDNSDQQAHDLDDDDSADEYRPDKANVSNARRSQSTTSSENDNQIVPSTEMSLGLPPISMENSLHALVSHQDASGRIDPAAIQRLGMSIANQIADFLTRATSGTLHPNSHFSSDPWSVPPLPKDAFVQTRSLDMTPRPDRYPSVMDSPGASSLWAPAPDSRRTRPNKRRKTHHQSESAPHRQGPDHATSAHSNQDDSDSTSTPDSRGASEMPYYGLGAHGRPLKRPPRMKFRKEEDELLKRLRDHDGLSWQQITSHFPHRTPIALQSRYTRALKHLPRPVVIKREIIEIVDGDDDFQSDATPNYRLIPPDLSSSRRQPETPLLRQALSRNLVDRDDSPLTVADDDETDTESIPPYPAYGNAPPPGYSYPPPGYYYPQPGQQPGFAYPFSPYPPPIGMWYPQVAPSPTSKPAKSKAKARKYHNKPEKQPRYGQFDTSQGDGSFGILRSDQPRQMISTPQQHLIGAQTATTGAFGVLRMGDVKPKPRKLEKAMKKPNYPSHRSAKHLTRKSSSDQPHESSPVENQAGSFRTMPPQARHSDMALNDQANPPLVRDDSEAPRETPYPQAGRSSIDNALYPSYNIPQTKGSNSDDGIFTHAVGSVQIGQESSPPLPTPPSDGSTKFSRQLPLVSKGVAPLAQMIKYSEMAHPQPPGTVAKIYGAAYGTPHHPNMSPTPASQSREARGVGIVMTRATIGDPESEDELA